MVLPARREADELDASGAGSIAPPEQPRPAASRRAVRVIGLLALGLLLVAGAISVSAFGPPDGFAAQGIVVGGVDVGGKDEADVRRAVEGLAKTLAARELRLVLGDRELHVSPAEIGFVLDVDRTTQAVLAAGREHGVAALLRSINRTRLDVPLTFQIDPTAFNEVSPSWEIALVEDQPFDGAIELENGLPIARPPRDGHRIDQAALLAKIEAEIARAGVGPIDVPVIAVSPPILAADVEARVADARAILEGPITLVFQPTQDEIDAVLRENEEALKRHQESVDRAKFKLPEKKKRMKRKGKRLVQETEVPKRPDTHPVPQAIELTFTKEELLAAYRARRVEEPTPHFEVELDEAEVKRKIAPIVAQLFNPSRDAKFEIDNDSRVSIVPSRPGTRVDTSRLVQAMLAAARSSGRRGELPVDKNAQPKFTTADAEALGIKSLVSEFTTHHACCMPRVKNIHRICDMLDGAIIRTGETFSVNAAVGPRTLERGFVVAPSIGDGEMTETPGGGVSQFATTLYNALFNGAYTIRERKPHSFYFNRYPMGIEATLSFPKPDLVFFNDSKAAILLRCDYGDTFIRVRLFGDNGQKTVERQVSQPFDYTDPRVEYLPNPNRDPEKEKVKDGGSHGFSVNTTRIIISPDGSRKEEKRTVKYTGRPRLIEVHPCKIPKGEKGYTGEKCPKPPEEESGSGGGSG
ncbi:MAG: VanW family protein [Polyangiaceae bacterium]